MKRTLAFLYGCGLPALCLATEPMPYAGYCTLLDRVASVATSNTQASGVALQVLERIALDRASEISPQTQQQVGLSRDQLEDKGFRATETRICAIRKIGETALPEAVEFLKSVDKADLGTDPQTVMLLRVTAQGAIRVATLRQIQDPQLQIEYLERTATEMAGSGLGMWAVDQLCDRASLASLVTIQQSVRRTYSGKPAEDYIEFCEARIRTLYGKPDRAKALGGVLNVQTSPDNAQLTTWAIEQLKLTHSPEADAELARFLNEIDSLPDDSPSKQRLLQFRPWLTHAPPRIKK